MTNIELTSEKAGSDDAKERKRLKSNKERVLAALLSGEYMTIEEIAKAADLPASADITRRIRELREPKNGGHKIEVRKAKGTQACYYRLISYLESEEFDSEVPDLDIDEEFNRRFKV